MVEQSAHNRKVGGSNPPEPIKINVKSNDYYLKGGEQYYALELRKTLEVPDIYSRHSHSGYNRLVCRP